MVVTCSRGNPALLNRVANSGSVRSLPPKVTIISRAIMGCGCPIGFPGDTTISMTNPGCLVNLIFMGRGAAGQHESAVTNYRKQVILDSQVLAFAMHDFRILPRKGHFAPEPSISRLTTSDEQPAYTTSPGLSRTRPRDGRTRWRHRPCALASFVPAGFLTPTGPPE